MTIASIPGMINSSLLKRTAVKDVLIVDDEEPFLQSVTEGLAAAMPELNVITATNGKQALEMLRTAVLDLVITDLKMPEMDGFEFLERLRQRLPNVRVIVLSLLDGEEVRRRIDRLGVERYLEKPLDLQTLLWAIEGDEAAPVISGGSVRAARAGTKSVLFMDSDAAVRNTVRMMLEEWGYTVCLTSSGEEAVGQYVDGCQRGDPFDVVLLDLFIEGGMGGREAMRLIGEADPRARVILVSGSIDDPVFSDFSEYGFCLALPKPYTPEQLHAAIVRATQGDGRQAGHAS